MLLSERLRVLQQACSRTIQTSGANRFVRGAHHRRCAREGLTPLMMSHVWASCKLNGYYAERLWPENQNRVRAAPKALIVRGDTRSTRSANAKAATVFIKLDVTRFQRWIEPECRLEIRSYTVALVEENANSRDDSGSYLYTQVADDL